MLYEPFVSLPLVTIATSSPSQTEQTPAVHPLNETETVIRGSKAYGQRLLQHAFPSELALADPLKTVPDAC